MRELLRTNHGVVTLDEEARVLHRVRSAEPFASLGELEAECEDLLRVMESIDRPRYVQLIDVRSAPPRNDPQFETTIERYHAALYRGFVATAVLVRSAVGKLHVRRMLEESGVRARAFNDEGEAAEYLDACRASANASGPRSAPAPSAPPASSALPR